MCCNNWYVDSKDNKNNEKEWYENLWGLLVITLGMNLLSNWIYDKAQERNNKTRKRQRKFTGSHEEK